MQRSRAQKGFTLVEAVIYIGIVGIIGVTLVQFFLNIHGLHARGVQAQQLQSDEQLVLLNLERLVQDAAAVDVDASVWDDAAGSLVLVMDNAALNPTTIVRSGLADTLTVQLGAGESQSLVSTSTRVTQFTLQEVSGSSRRTSFRVILEFAQHEEQITRTRMVTTTLTTRQ